MQCIPGSEPMAVTPLSSVNTRICLLRESERLFISLKISHDCTISLPFHCHLTGDRKTFTGRVKAGQLSSGHADSYLEVRLPRKDAITLQGLPSV